MGWFVRFNDKLRQGPGRSRPGRLKDAAMTGLSDCVCYHSLRDKVVLVTGGQAGSGARS